MDTQPLYRQLASHYLHAIEAGTLAPGERMPSVRALMARHDVSLSTALQTCRHLENQGLLEARPRSGYFVRMPGRHALAAVEEPVPTVPDPAQYVGIHERVSAIIARGRQSPGAINLCGASGAPSLYPVEALKTAAMRALRNDPELFGAQAPPNGHPAFRSILAKRALAARINVHQDEIIVTYGCVEALNLALRAVAQPGDVIAVESPTFFGLLQILESLGMRALEIPTSPQTGISLEALELAVQTYDNIKAVVVVPNLQNPLGSIMPDANKENLVHWCEAQGIPLIEDDTYGALSNADTPLAALKAWDHSDNVIHCASINKVLAPGMRLGWIAAGKWHARVEMLKYAQSRPNEALAQITVADYMASPAFDRHVRRLRGNLREQRERMAEAVAAYFPVGTRLSVPAGGVCLWIELPGKLSSEALFNAALVEGIHIAPGVMFSNSRRFDHFLRVSCGMPWSRELDHAIRRLAAVVSRLLGA
ncbi:aminotransferase-like domain-containing protein [Andreprevotia chitinilytica]|uniref:aminotransferase-like domain-containing protein n=1 Tax=Andreprevotia chitinilytica TaxID=396808 RepID=UPI0005508106|nr:PLP-dependent aminotransferase family protein [Andreprevotia chitinilytica]